MLSIKDNQAVALQIVSREKIAWEIHYFSPFQSASIYQSLYQNIFDDYIIDILYDNFIRLIHIPFSWRGVRVIPKLGQLSYNLRELMKSALQLVKSYRYITRKQTSSPSKTKFVLFTKKRIIQGFEAPKIFFKDSF